MGRDTDFFNIEEEDEWDSDEEKQDKRLQTQMEKCEQRISIIQQST
jgi:hypothetical protein